MSIHFLNNLLKNGNDTTATCLCYKFKLACDEKANLYDIVAKQDCGLSLVPGVVLGNSNLPCSLPFTKIRMAPCQTQAAIISPVEIEAQCQPICEGFDQCSPWINEENGCDSCCIWTSTTKKASASCARVGDTITYTITFTNHSPCNLDMVYISDEVPAEVTVVLGSIHPAPKPGETLETGISVGSVPAFSSVAMTYQVRIRSCMSKYVINQACVKYCYTDCRGCKRYGVGQCKQSVVKILPVTAGIAIVKSANKRFVCRICEEISYTLTISNTGNSTITDVTVYDDIPQGLCYKKNSTRRNNCAPADENPAHGIYIGSLLPGETRLVSFILVVCMPICCNCHPTKFVNMARASGYSCGREVSGRSKPWVVTMHGRCFCQCVRVCFPIWDFINVKDCYIYHRGATCHQFGDWRFVSAEYGICIKYVDSSGAIRKKVFESNIIFFNLPEDTPDQFIIRFTHLNCCSDFCGNMMAEFTAHLHYCNKG